MISLVALNHGEHFDGARLAAVYVHALGGTSLTVQTTTRISWINLVSAGPFQTTLTAADLRAQINSVLAVELRSLLPKTQTSEPANLAHLPSPRPLPSSPFFAAELARVAAKKPLPAGQGLDTTRYSLPAPVGSTSLDAWKAAHDSSLAQLEHQRLRGINGQILGSAVGANAWRIQNFSLENTLERIEKEGEELRSVVEDLNRERKRSQESGGVVLSRMEKKWTELISGNMQLEIGCMTLYVPILAPDELNADA